MSQTARSVALEAIRRIVDEGAYSTIVVPGALRRSRLDERDRAFATELAFGTVRRLVPIDWALDRVASRPVHRMSPGVRTVLRLGAYQVLFTDIAAHAAVGETVGMATPRERGFANAILRRLAADPPAWPDEADEAAESIRTGLSRWAVAELGRLVARDEVEAVATSFATPAPLCLRTNTAVVDPDRLRQALLDAGHEPRPASLDPTCFLLEGGNPARLPGFDDGWFAVQDQASAFVVRALEARPGDRVLDACAAPGGKTAYLASIVGADGLVVGADVHPGRVASIRRVADRLSLEPVILAQDATAPALRGVFDRILVDAPCSGLGSARRRPELLWRNDKHELSRLARTQVEIVSGVTDLLSVGGRMVYSVCTFPRAETDAAADAIVRHRPDLVPVTDRRPRRPRRSRSALAASPRQRRHVRRGVHEEGLRAAATMARVGKLAASILSADLAHLADQVKLVHEHADIIHIDIMDGHFVPPIALGTVVVASLRPHTDLTMHGHLMVDAPRSFFEELAEAGLDVVSFHHEAVPDAVTAIDHARAAGLGAGRDDQDGHAGRRGLPVPGARRRRDVDEHRAGVERSDPGRRGVPASRSDPRRDRSPRPRRGRGDRRRREGRQRAASDGRRCDRAGERERHLPSRRPRRERSRAAERSRTGRPHRWPRRSSSSTTIRTSRASSR